MSSTPKLDAKSLPHIPGYTVWENVPGTGRPGYLPGSGNQYVDLVDGLSGASKQEARFTACVVLVVFGGAFGFTWGNNLFGGQGAVIGMFIGAAAGVAVGYVLGPLLVRLAAALLVLVPIGIVLWLAGSWLIYVWHR